MDIGIAFGRIHTLEEQMVSEAYAVVQEVVGEESSMSFDEFRSLIGWHLKSNISDIMTVAHNDELVGLCIVEKSVDDYFYEVRIRKFFCLGGQFEHSHAHQFLMYIVRTARDRFGSRLQEHPKKLMVSFYPRHEWENLTMLFTNSQYKNPNCEFAIKDFRTVQGGSKAVAAHFEKIVAP